jgi:HTH-type transcriptional regulator, sugar sensing transcriptional regulator
MLKDTEREKLEALIRIGLNASEAKIYLGLLTRHDFSATEIAKYAKLSRPAAYDVLDKMIRLGICKEKPGKVKKFMAISPIVALPRFIEHQSEEQRQIQESRERKISDLAPILEAAFQLGRGQDDPLDYFELLRDKKQIINRIINLQKDAERELLTLVKPPYVLTHTENPDQFNLLKRGVVERSIYEFTGDHNKMVEWIKPTYEAGEEARICKTLPMKMQIYDCKTSLFALNDPLSGKASFTTLCIVHRDFSLMLRRAFESLWAESIPYEDLANNPTLIDDLQ